MMGILSRRSKISEDKTDYPFLNPYGKDFFVLKMNGFLLVLLTFPKVVE